ncbi:MAG TPA: metal ABC transporter permease [Chloroflexota bacterium]|nr:metal ABC transporter permease [Chloroflexota bacterium]
MPWIPDPMTSALGWLLAPLAFDFMRRAVLASVLVGAVCAVIGAFVVLKGLAFIGDALAHASFAGVAVALIARGNVYLGGALAAVFAALAIAFIGQRARVRADTAIGIVFVAMLAFGVLVMSRLRNYSASVFEFLFGNVLAVSADDLVLIVLGGALVVGTIVLLYKEFLFVTFDPVMAAGAGIPVAVYDTLLLVLLALTTTVAMRALGIILVAAMLVTPAATAFLYTRRLHHLMLLAVAIAVGCSILGLYLSFYGNFASGASIVLVSVLVFLGSLAVAPRLRGRAAVAALGRH